jgi:DNA-directed RNA polymerase subunit RPC12/RpoP
VTRRNAQLAAFQSTRRHIAVRSAVFTLFQMSSARSAARSTVSVHEPTMRVLWKVALQACTIEVPEVGRVEYDELVGSRAPWFAWVSALVCFVLSASIAAVFASPIGWIFHSTTVVNVIALGVGILCAIWGLVVCKQPVYRAVINDNAEMGRTKSCIACRQAVEHLAGAGAKNSRNSRDSANVQITCPRCGSRSYGSGYSGNICGQGHSWRNLRSSQLRSPLRQMQTDRLSNDD